LNRMATSAVTRQRLGLALNSRHSVRVSDEALDQASALYDEAEQAWEVADDAAPPSPQGITRYYDPPEIVATLWRDLAEAYDRRAQ